MGFDPVTISTILGAAAQAAPLITGRGADPTAAMTSPPPQPQQNRQPQSMQVPGGGGGQDQALQAMLMLMQKLAQMQQGQQQQSPMQQAMAGAQAGPPVNSMNRQQGPPQLGPMGVR